METLGDQGSGRMADTQENPVGQLQMCHKCACLSKVSKQLHVNYTVIEEASLIILMNLPFLKKTFYKNHPEFTLMDLGLLQGLVPGHRVVEEEWNFKVSVLCSCVIPASAGAVHTGSRHFSSSGRL